MLMALPHVAFAQDVHTGEEPFFLTGEKFTLDFDSTLLLSQAATDTAGSDTSAGTSEADEQAQIAEALANPLSYL